MEQALQDYINAYDKILEPFRPMILFVYVLLIISCVPIVYLIFRHKYKYEFDSELKRFGSASFIGMTMSTLIFLLISILIDFCYIIPQRHPEEEKYMDICTENVINTLENSEILAIESEADNYNLCTYTFKYINEDNELTFYEIKMPRVEKKVSNDGKNHICLNEDGDLIFIITNNDICTNDYELVSK